MPEQDTPTAQEPETATKETEPAPDKQVEEQEPAKTHFEAESPDDQGTLTGGPANTGDEPTSTDEQGTLTGGPANTADEPETANAKGEDDPPKDDSGDEKVAVAVGDENPPGGDGKAQDESATDSELVDVDYSGDDDETYGAHEGDEAEPVDGQSSSIPEATIGVSNVEPLPDQTLSQSPAVAQIQNSAPLADVDIASDEVENKDLIEKPTVDEDPAPGNLPDLPSSAANDGKNQSQDGVNLESGDGDVSDPSKTTPDAEQGPGQAKLAEPETGAKSGADPDTKAGTLDDDLETKKAGDDSARDEAKEADQPAEIPTVEPALSAAVELPEQEAPATVESEPAAAGTELGNDSLATPPAPAGFENSLDVMDLIDPDGPPGVADIDPVAKVESDGASSPVDDPDVGSAATGNDTSSDSQTGGGTPVAFDDATPPMAGPDLGAAVAGLDNGAAIDTGGREEGQAPISDSSGIQSGEAVTTQTGTVVEDEVQVSKMEDGSTVQTTTFPDGSMIVDETSADGSTSSSTSYDKDGKWVGTSTTTHNKDGTTVTEIEEPDGTVREVHSDGTTIIHHPDGETELIEPDDEDANDDEEDEHQDEQQEQEQQQQEEEDTDTEEPDETDTTDDTDANNSGDNSATRPDDDGLVDEDKIAAMHETEAAWAQAIRESSVINPGRTDAGAPEGGGEPPPGVDDPPDDESPRPDELPESNPADIGLNQGTIDFGPDHVEEPHGGGSDPAATEAIGGSPDQPEFPDAGPDTTIAFDPTAMTESTGDLVDHMSGVSPDSGLGFLSEELDFELEAEEEPPPFDDGDDLF